MSWIFYLIIGLIVIPLIIAIFITYLQDKLKNKYIIPVLIIIGLVYFWNKTNTCPTGSLEAVGCGFFYMLWVFYFLLSLAISIISPFRSLGLLMNSKEIGQKTKDKFENELSQNKKILLNKNNDIYYFKKDKYGSLFGCLVIDKKDDTTCKIEIIDSNESKMLNKKVKARLVLTKLRKLGYKKVILNKDTYNYLENSFDKYKIISIENADDYMLEL